MFHSPSCDLMMYHVSRLIVTTYLFFFLKLLRVYFVRLQCLLGFILCTSALPE